MLTVGKKQIERMYFIVTIRAIMTTQIIVHRFTLTENDAGLTCYLEPTKIQ